ncbi:MAG TPA: amidohydrolase family protein [Acidimicrobiales bacterium]|nr:amidohydrolase family protein [Acidimicrobiales bacterium]
MAFTGPGFVDHHTHLLRVAAGVKPPYDYSSTESIAAYHRALFARGDTPMSSIGDDLDVALLDAQLMAGLEHAASVGLVQITEAGMHDWAYFDALQRRREEGRLECRVRILVADGLAAEGMRERTGDSDLDVIGVKFYADGWLGPRTCALCSPFADVHPADDGVLFLEPLVLARRAQKLAEAGWVIATHAIGDRAIDAVLDAYDMVFGGDPAAAAAAGARIEHAQVLSPALLDRLVDSGVTACIQPSFSVSDEDAAAVALGAERAKRSYDWRGLVERGGRVITGADYPIEALAPLTGLRDLCTGPEQSRLDVGSAFDLMTDASAGTTTLDADPRTLDAEDLAEIADIAVIGTSTA